MIRPMLLTLSLLFPMLSYAQLSSSFIFNGQNSELLKNEVMASVPVKVKVTKPSTCTRQVPHVVRECNSMPQSREVCEWVPASRNCYQTSEEVCRPVTRQREQCSGGGTRTVCTERPTREVCRTDRSGNERCTTVGGGTSCHEVPESGSCWTETYTDQDCDTVSRNRCDDVPAHNECRNVTTTESVCEDVTRYVNESYACTEEIEEVQQKSKKLVSEVQVQILTNGVVEEFPLTVNVKEASKDFKAFTAEVRLGKEPKAYVVVQRATVKKVSETETEIQLKGNVVLEILEASMLPIGLPDSIASAQISEGTKEMVITFEGGVSAFGKFEVSISHKALLSRTKQIVDFKAEYPTEGIQLGQVGDRAALKISLKDRLLNSLESRNMRLKFKLLPTLNIQGEIINTKKPMLEKTYEGMFVNLVK